MDMREFEMVYRAHYRMVYQYALSLTQKESVAEDLVQEAFLRYCRSIDKFRGECSETSWLCGIVKNLWFDRMRKEKRLEPLAGERADSKDMVKELEDKETAQWIHKALHELPEPYKEVFSLRVFGELSFAQIASLFQRSESWARVTYSRAKVKISERLDKEV